MKKCNACGEDKELSEYSLKRNKSGSISVRSTCRRCALNKQKEQRKLESVSARNSRLLKQKAWVSQNRDKVNALKAKYRIKDKAIKLSSVIHEAHVTTYLKCIDKVSNAAYESHVIEWRRNRTLHTRWRSKHDMAYVSFNRLKRGVQRLFQNSDVATEGWFSLLGYTTTDLMVHIESQFVDGMSWDNRHDWHIDHIKPLCSIDIKSIHDPEFKECFALRNLRPIWAHHNRMKYHCFDKRMHKNKKRVLLSSARRG